MVDFLQIIDDVLIFKKRTLTLDERQMVIDEIYRMQDLLKPLGVANLSRHILDNQEDTLLVEILDQQYQLFAFKYFKESSHTKQNKYYTPPFRFL